MDFQHSVPAEIALGGQTLNASRAFPSILLYYKGTILSNQVSKSLSKSRKSVSKLAQNFFLGRQLHS